MFLAMTKGKFFLRHHSSQSYEIKKKSEELPIHCTFPNDQSNLHKWEYEHMFLCFLIT